MKWKLTKINQNYQMTQINGQEIECRDLYWWEKKLSILFENIRHEINIEIAGITGILNGSAVGDSGQAHIAQMKLGKIVEILDSLT